MKFHHVGIAVRDAASHAARYQNLFGLSPTTNIIEDELQKVRVALADAGDGVFVEFVEPLGEDSPVNRFLERGGGYTMCATRCRILV